MHSSLKAIHMKKHYLLFILSLLFGTGLFATDHTIVTAGFTYSPSTLAAAIGDNVTIVASGNHPTTQVSQETWDGNGTTPLPDGFGTNTSSFTFTIEEAGTIYYVCDNHVGAGMKGQINVSTVGVDEYVDEVNVDFGAMPITDGTLTYAIEAPENAVKSISVVGLNGQQVLEAEVTSSEGRLELNARPGVYIVLLKDADGNLVFRESISVK
jgi:plastocyanin